MAFTQKVRELDESRNLNTSPWTVSLKGDSNDIAFMAFCDSSNANTSDLLIRFNSDSGSNYNVNNMYGNGTARSQVDLTGQTACRIDRFTKMNGDRHSLCIGVIRGDSSQNRTLTSIHSSGDPRIYQDFSEWTNNVDELTSLEFSNTVSASYKWHIVVWEVPKLNNNDNWELVDTLSWSASATEQSFTGLTGDTDLFYKILWDSDIHHQLNIEINNDATAGIYTHQQLKNSGTAFVSNNSTQSKIRSLNNGLTTINAETGDERTSFGFSGEGNGDPQTISAHWYANTVTEVTSLYCTPGTSVTATAKLFKAKYPASSVPDIFDLPFKKVDSFSVNTADFTAGQSFTGLDGDNVILYRLEFKGLLNPQIQYRTNGDSGSSDYASQKLQGQGTGESANYVSSKSHIDLSQSGGGKQAYAVSYIYPQSGEYRPALTYSMNTEDRITLFAGWRLDSVTEITSIEVLANTSGTITGTFTLSEIRL